MSTACLSWLPVPRAWGREFESGLGPRNLRALKVYGVKYGRCTGNKKGTGARATGRRLVPLEAPPGVEVPVDVLCAGSVGGVGEAAAARRPPI